jgi:integrase
VGFDITERVAELVPDHRSQPREEGAVAAVFEPTDVPKDRNPHRLRHTFGADMARHGVRITTLQRMMGHSSPAMTLHYINLSMGEIADELRRATEQIQRHYEAES